MTKPLSDPRKKFIALTEGILKRPLRRGELHAVLGLDEFVVDTALEIFTAEQMVELLNDVAGVSNPSRLFETLAKATRSLEEDREKLIAFLQAKPRDCLKAFDFGDKLEQFSRWFLQLLRDDPPQGNIQALNFGLYESSGTCRVYVAGAKTYNKENPDWACSRDWWKETHVFPEALLSKIWADLQRCGAEPWVGTQGIIIILVKAFFSEHAVEFQKRSGLRRVHVATGFDDGDMYAVRTPIAPRA